MKLADYYHVYDYFARSNTTGGDSPLGIVFWTDLTVAVVLLVLYVLHAHSIGVGREAAAAG